MNNIDDNLFKKDDLYYRSNVYKLIKDMENVHTKIQHLTEVVLHQKDDINKLNQIIKKYEEKINKLQEDISTINRTNYIESYRSIRRGIPMPYVPILSKDVSSLGE